MIYVGYPCIGKSSISCSDNSFIDLESSNMFYDVNGLGDYRRDYPWTEVYVNVAVDLSKQGYNVFVSSHGLVVEELNNRNIDCVAVYPSLDIKDDWIERAKSRYEQTKLDKNYRAYCRIRDFYEQDITDLKNKTKKHIEITDSNYDLEEWLKEHSK